MSLNEQLRCLFAPRAVAVIGASNTFGKWGFNIFKQLLDKSQGRMVYPVNEQETSVLGVKAYRDIREVPEPVELAVIAIPQRGVPQAVEACVSRGVKVAIVISAGFAESDTAGLEREREIVGIARKGGMRLLGPNCMGHFNVASDLLTSPFIPSIRRGGLGVITQSGNVGINIVHYGLEMGLGFSKFVNTGNEADLHLEDFLEYLAQDEETKVITAYIEGLREGRRFFALAKEVSRRKPIVVIKVGGTMSGAQAARSHTSALVGSDEVYNAAFKQAGVIRVGDVIELLDVAALLRQPLPQGRRVGILAGGGGFGVMGADACDKLGLEVASLSPATMGKLNTLLPSRWSHSNPIDTVGTAAPNPMMVYPVLKALMEDEGVDSILSLTGIGVGASLSVGKLTPMEQAREEEELTHLNGFIELMDRTGKPLVASLVITGVRRNSRVIKRLQEEGIFVYPLPQRAVKALSHLVEYSEYLRREA